MTVADFLPTHVVPPDGLPTWSSPDATRPTAPLDPLLPVQVVERRGDWACALCSNGWSAWVDGRLLLPVPHGPPAAGQPAARTADPRPLLGTVEDQVSRYRRLVEELTSGRIDGAEFAEQTRGLRVGVIVDGNATWLYDARHERWLYCDGFTLEPYAVGRGPTDQGRADADRAEGDDGGPGGGGPGGSGPGDGGPGDAESYDGAAER
ncbi:hypothetical protein [Streptomyces sp. Da 82-17]|uniref:hypothetical protein n=1 Tax=Streptomyces sp. Da 82-17 TaxID=3377116 RepID=UPI0038D41822